MITLVIIEAILLIIATTLLVQYYMEHKALKIKYKIVRDFADKTSKSYMEAQQKIKVISRQLAEALLQKKEVIAKKKTTKRKSK